MNDLKQLYIYMKEHKGAAIATLFGAFAGAFLGVMAYYKTWLG